MSKYEYGNFSDGGSDLEFVAHAKKFTKEKVVELCIQENDHRFMAEYCNGRLHKEPTIEDITERTVRYYPVVPEFCGYDGDNGCYTYCKKGERGSFPVWVIEFEKLRV